MRFTRFVSALGLLSLLGLVPWLAGCGRGAPAPAGPIRRRRKRRNRPRRLKAARPAAWISSTNPIASWPKSKGLPGQRRSLGRDGQAYKVIIQAAPSSSAAMVCEAEFRAHPDKYLKKLEK